MEELTRPPMEHEVTRLRVVLTTRFLNIRILTHRPLLCKFLEIIGSAHVDVQQLTVLRQVGANSIRTCAQSAVLLIDITQWALQHSESSRQLLGAWWFSLYYGRSIEQTQYQPLEADFCIAFNAGLVVYSILLVQHQARHHNQGISLEEPQLSTESLQKAIKCLSGLYKGNRMTEKCVRYMSTLATQLATICSTPVHGLLGGNLLTCC